MDAMSLLASPRRVELLRLTWNAEQPASSIHQSMPDVTFGAVSLQLKQLVEAGLMEARAEGRFRYYRARKVALGPLAAVLEQMWSDGLWRLKVAAEMEQRKRGPKPARAGLRETGTKKKVQTKAHQTTAAKRAAKKTAKKKVSQTQARRRR